MPTTHPPRSWRSAAVVSTTATLTALALASALPGANPPAMGASTATVQETAAQLPDLTGANRRAPVPGLPDWSKAGYRGGAALPGPGELNPDGTCQITAAELATTYGVRPGDGADDSAGLQRAVDHIRTTCSPSAGYARLSLIALPAGRIDVSRQIALDADYLVIRGAGAGQTSVVFRPDANTRYDSLTPDGSDWDEDGMTSGSAKGGWIWPGRGLFRVQTREAAARYAGEYAAAPANRKDLFEGSVNQHWAGGVALRAKAAGFSALAGERLIHLASNASMTNFRVGGYLWVGAANSVKFYRRQTATDAGQYLNQHMRVQIFQISAVDPAARTVTIDKPLEFDLPVNSTSDGSAAIDGTTYPSRVTPLKVVQGVGIEDLTIGQDMTGLPKLGGGTYALNRADAVHNYGNMAPEYALHGIVLKWAANSWIRRVRTDMTGSHPVVTENAKNIQVQETTLDGSWNKGKGGNGYFRGSRVWDSLYAGNTSRNLRHFTFQWSASGNVALGNDFDSDLNLHGGWERRNLFEGNTVNVPFEHASKNCRSNCGDEGGSAPDDSTWWPIWWAAGPKALKWSGSSGPQNVFYGNTLRKQTGVGGPYTDFAPYADRRRIYQFGSSAAEPAVFAHLAIGGTTIPDWASRETVDYSAAPNSGVNATGTDSTGSLFLKSGTTPTPTPTPTVTPTPTPTVTPTPTPTPTPTGGGRVVEVGTPAQLKTALAGARAGDVIKLADGVYKDEFVATVPGTATAPITLTGSRNAVLENDHFDAASGCPSGHLAYGLHLNGAGHWRLTGFTVRDSKKGIVMDGAVDTVIDGVYVHHIQEEGVHFRKGSSGGVIRNSTVTDVGTVKPQYGEGVYIGSANSNWSCFGGSDGVDRTRDVQVIGNTIGPNVAAEAVDAKEGTDGGVIRGNHFDGTGQQNQNSGDSWLDIKGDGYLIESNTGVNPYTEGARVQTVYSPYGCGNVFRANRFDLGAAPGYAIHVNNQSSCSAKNVVYSSNTSTGGKGLTNIPVTP